MNALQECMFVSVVDDYKHGFIGSRELLRQAELVAGNHEAAQEVLASVGFSAAELWARDKAPTAKRPQAPSGVTVSPEDATISVRSITYRGQSATLSGYVAQPADPERHPGIIVIHENRGLVEHIKDVARRLAKAGFVALAPDLLARVGGTEHFASLDELQSTLRKLSRRKRSSPILTLPWTISRACPVFILTGWVSQASALEAAWPGDC